MNHASVVCPGSIASTVVTAKNVNTDLFEWRWCGLKQENLSLRPNIAPVVSNDAVTDQAQTWIVAIAYPPGFGKIRGERRVSLRVIRAVKAAEF